MHSALFQEAICIATCRRRNLSEFERAERCLTSCTTANRLISLRAYNLGWLVGEIPSRFTVFSDYEKDHLRLHYDY